ncbi:MAG: sigma-54-dependent Fis family transcriptional regulator [Rhizobiales bacterium]|nr:sigma-54 dependent transcriptional regulator [Hyphomicrobiales bacterium]NRB13896.1 sigma-54-dependent Fis family transcriptional regulator [Hyphomicrobiales bacterium]
MNHLDILIIEDSCSLTQTYIEYLKPTGFNVIHCANGTDALKLIDSQSPSLVLLDLKLPDMPGMRILDHIQACTSPANVIIITAHGSVEIAVEAMQKGAFDFLLKPFSANRLRTTVTNAFNNRKLVQIVKTFEAAVPNYASDSFIGQSPAMKAIYHMIKNAAASDAAVFITGESGTGKELCAEALHSKSKRNARPFVVVNCGAIPRELLESEIFGHKKGAFTGAISERDGLASTANGGTLFLDEIAELDINLQIKLLRFIQTKTFRKVGGNKDITVDIRFICATNRNPIEQVRLGKFREDLYYRLNVIPIEMPPLRQREGDVLLLLNHFLKLFNAQENKDFLKFSDAALMQLTNHPWPGNVRELQNVIQRTVVMNNGGLITSNMLPALTARSTATSTPMSNQVNQIANPTSANWFVPDGSEADGEQPNSSSVISAATPLWMIEKNAIQQTIDICKGNVVKAAACLELSPSTVYRKMRNWGIEL